MELEEHGESTGQVGAMTGRSGFAGAMEVDALERSVRMVARDR